MVQHLVESPDGQHEKQPYETPTVTKLGTVTDLTRGIGSTLPGDSLAIYSP